MFMHLAFLNSNLRSGALETSNVEEAEEEGTDTSVSQGLCCSEWVPEELILGILSQVCRMKLMNVRSFLN